ncbi:MULTISPECIES: nicotinate (nicotinamide) nucleotide adenylyltransferase [unclassified Leptolyngbya]|uniref:nicotinate (nicotinamide) nucleotide adenylyltransferase n=1 Tax=unclassified Leptolyngbya TaxID=2650499 RepID=UPI001687BB07|nr:MULTISPECIES: nicotinate (nicotinamide) nucleotide adenylyltransferase [unclassified Leptolyngbya]MBD1914221.1 nicotinate (nicotinamide) nucleotide adenylyltransferase [Leptolyngbya sp. FACHB-8]MBD2157228.1 nicotinate (nicotinamide) nucleotide adenylyltransferase [Leptolyngbya sp. FACHB-16]
MAVDHLPHPLEPNNVSPQHRGIFGGTFNPPHAGHLQVAQAALTQAGLTQVLWVPTYRPPHRRVTSLVSFEHRLEMVQQAIAPFAPFHASAVEEQLAYSAGGPSFAIHTLTHLQHQYSKSHWYWILGLDAFCTLPRWRHHRELVPQCTWLIAPRSASSTTVQNKPDDFQQIEAIAHLFKSEGISLRWHLLSMPSIEISSSLIRRYCGDRLSISGLVPIAVEDYIHRYNLYGADS